MPSTSPLMKTTKEVRRLISPPESKLMSCKGQGGPASGQEYALARHRKHEGPRSEEPLGLAVWVGCLDAEIERGAHYWLGFFIGSDMPACDPPSPWFRFRQRRWLQWPVFTIMQWVITAESPSQRKVLDQPA